MKVKPILFNTEMVRAILDGRKTVTRRAIKPQPQGHFEVSENPIYIYDTDFSQGKIMPPYQTGDILYVRERFCKIYSAFCELYIYYADKPDDVIAKFENGEEVKWNSPVIMPKEATRIWLKVTDVRVERLQDITEDEVCDEGVDVPIVQDVTGEMVFEYSPIDDFADLWDSTVQKQDLDTYGWDANPWVWVIEFERCEKPESEG